MLYKIVSAPLQTKWILGNESDHVRKRVGKHKDKDKDKNRDTGQRQRRRHRAINLHVYSSIVQLNRK